jgi:hypothetical protein
VRIENTLKVSRMYVSEALLPKLEGDSGLRVVEEPGEMRFGDDGAVI